MYRLTTMHSVRERERETDRQTDRQTDDRMMSIADHTACTVVIYNGLKT